MGQEALDEPIPDKPGNLVSVTYLGGDHVDEIFFSVFRVQKSHSVYLLLLRKEVSFLLINNYLSIMNT